MPLKTSKLCQSFPKIMRKSSSMLEYFIQYMESVDALQLVQFWLAAESFKAQNHSQPSLGENARHMNSDNSGSGNSDNSGSPSVTSCRSDTTGSHMGCSRTSEAAPGPHEADVGGTRHMVLRRRDTENHKYCNCGISMHHQQPTPPLTPKQGSRISLALSPLQHESNSERTVEKDSEYASPRLKMTSGNVHADVLASMNPTPGVRDVPLTDLLESTNQLENLPPTMTPDVLSSPSMTPDVLSSSSDMFQRKNRLPDVLGLMDKISSPKDLPPDVFTPKDTPLDLIPDAPKELSLASEDPTPDAHTPPIVHHSTHLS